jgi:hypothetical protein
MAAQARAPRDRNHYLTKKGGDSQPISNFGPVRSSLTKSETDCAPVLVAHFDAPIAGAYLSISIDPNVEWSELHAQKQVHQDGLCAPDDPGDGGAGLLGNGGGRG